MKTVRQRDTKPEIAVRRLLWSAGARFRTCPRDLPGRPDIANKGARWAVFVHGCFWHGHRGCKLATVPQSNRAFWQEKLASNRRRDARKALALRRLGFLVFVVWQCELRNPDALVRRFFNEGVTKQ
jgi:DNA mismatch endonuclease (patch repair protein)